MHKKKIEMLKERRKEGRKETNRQASKQKSKKKINLKKKGSYVKIKKKKQKFLKFKSNQRIKL